MYYVVIFSGDNVKHEVGTKEYEDGTWCKVYEESYANESEYNFHIIIESNIRDVPDAHVTLTALGIAPFQQQLELIDGKANFHFQSTFELNDILRDTKFPVLMHCVVYFVLSNVSTDDKLSICLPRSRENIKLLSENMEELLTSGAMSDVTLCVDSSEIKVHKAILSARAPLFLHKLLEKADCTDRIAVTYIPFDDLKELLKYIYTGKVIFTNTERALELYIAAQKYSLTYLKNECIDFLQKCIHLENVLHILRLAHAYDDKALKEKSFDFISRNLSDVKHSEEYEVLVTTNKDLVMEMLNFAANKSVKFDAGIKHKLLH